MTQTQSWKHNFQHWEDRGMRIKSSRSSLATLPTLRIAWDTQNLVLQKQSKIKNKTIETGCFPSILNTEMLKYEHMNKGQEKYGWIGHKENEHFPNREKDDPISL